VNVPRQLLVAALGAAGAAYAALLVAACGGSPSSPGPVTPGGGGGQTISNSAPVIESVTVSTERLEVGDEVTLSAAVTDAETPLDQLKFEWTAAAGTISGQGTSVKWRAPGNGSTPQDYTVTLTVTETYGAAGATHIVTATSPTIRVHDSQKELGEMGVAFLTDFANSSIPASVCVRDFSDSCSGKTDELNDITENRSHFEIIGSSLRLRGVTISSNNVRANMTVACSFTSRIKKCDAGDSKCTVGSVGTVAGDCALTGVYEQKRWWLCDSTFSGSVVTAGFSSFFRR
jgi:hypothetical protein